MKISFLPDLNSPMLTILKFRSTKITFYAFWCKFSVVSFQQSANQALSPIGKVSQLRGKASLLRGKVS